MKAIHCPLLGGGIPKLLAAWLLGLLAWAASTTQAAQVTYSTTVSIQRTPWTNTVALPQFDPFLGTLQGATVVLDYTFRSPSRIENLDDVPRPEVIHGAAETFTVWDSLATTLLETTATVKFTNNLAAFDGIPFYDGTSGVTRIRQTVTGSATSPVLGSLTLFEGAGTLPLIIEAQSTGFALNIVNYLQQILPEAGGTLTVIYDYEEATAGATIGDRVWNDADGLGDQTPGESGMAGVTVTLLDSTGSILVDFPPVQTDGGGFYAFVGVPAGDYLVVVEPPVGFVPTYDLDGVDASYLVALTVTGNEVIDTVDFGFAQLSSNVGDRVWRDDNGDGVQDPGEPGLEGVTVTLFDSTGSVALATTTTDVAGGYGFAGLTAGDYLVQVSSVPAGYVASFDADGLGTPNTASFSLAGGVALDSLDFGYQPRNASVSGLAWQDRNRDGLNSPGESRLSGVAVRLLDASGTTELAAGLTAADGTYSFAGLSAGSYLVVLTPPTGYLPTFDYDGTGTANQSEVSVIANEDKGHIDFGYAGGSLGDRVWNDLNGDGLQDADEPGVAGATVTLSNGASTTTDASGFYSLGDLVAGTYTVTVTVPAGWVATGDVDGISTPGTATVTLAAGAVRSDVDFGYQERTASLGDRVWRDDNGDGIQDGGEPGLTGVAITLLNSAGTSTVATAVTDVNGYYGFAQLPAGSYRIQAEPPIRHLPTFDADGTTVPNQAAFTLAAGQARNDLDFGYQPLSTLGNLVWFDLNRDGLVGVGEPGLPFITVTASGTGGVFTTETDENGAYTLPNVPPGTYTVSVTVPAGLDATFDVDGITTPTVAVVTVAPATDRLDVDFGFAPEIGNLADGQVGGVIWNDADANGSVNGLEGGFPGLTVVLLNDAGIQLGTATTDSNGGYLFPGLTDGNYTVVVTPPVGKVATYDVDGLASLNTAAVTIAVDEHLLNVDFGYRQAPPALAQITGLVWDDADASGSRNGGELGLNGLTVTLRTSDGTVVTTATTDSSGIYRFLSVPAGSYSVSVNPPTYWGATYDIDGIGTADTAGVSVTPGQNLTGVDFGYQYAPPPGSLGDRVWADGNNNGQQDPDEGGVADVTVTLRDSNGVDLASVVTDETGTYSFLSVSAGTYSVVILPPTHYEPSSDLDGVSTPNQTAVSVAIGQERTDVDFGLHFNPPPALIGDRVWLDVNSNGVQDPDEFGLGQVAVTLRDVDNVVVASTTTDATGHYEFPGLAAGTYIVGITAPQYHIPTFDLDGIASVNLATLDVAIGETNRTVDFGLIYAPPLGSIGDRVWSDANGNGVQDGTETGLAGLTVTVRNVAQTFLATTVTDSTGRYSFSGLAAQTYTVTVSAPTNATPTFDFDGIGTPHVATVALAIGQDRTDVDFGYRIVVPVQLGSIGDLVWLDLNNNGLADPGEAGLTNVLVTLRNSLNAVVATTNTSSLGQYLFTELPADTYTVTVTPPANHFPLSDLDGLSTPNAAEVLLVAGQNRTDVDFAYVYVEPAPQVASIGDRVWLDTNGNGVQNAGEPGLNCVTVQLRNAAGTSVLATTVTDNHGNYTFLNVNAGNYRVQVLPPSGHTPTYDVDGTATPNVAAITLVGGVNRTDVDFGYCPPATASVGDRVWFDCNGNGVQDGSETGLVNWPVILRNSTGTAILTNKTAANGIYRFTNLAAGTYTVEVSPAVCYTPTWDADGTSTPNRATVNLAAGELRLNVDFGYKTSPATGRIGNLVWVDSNKNGVRNNGESGLPNATVRLYDNVTGNLLATRTTDCNGSYQFTSLAAGTYRVTVTPPSGYTPTYDLDGTSTASRTVVVLNSGQTRSDVDFGYARTKTGCK